MVLSAIFFWRLGYLGSAHADSAGDLRCIDHYVDRPGYLLRQKPGTRTASHSMGDYLYKGT